MVFSSAYFLFVFLPFALLLVLLGKRFQNTFLLIASLYFYAWGNFSHSIVLVFSIIVNYIVGIYIDKSEFRKRKLILGIGIVFNIGLLCYLKYFNFFMDSLNDLFASIGLKQVGYHKVILPIGVSFFTFQVVSYLIDVYRKVVPAQKNIINLGLYIAMFPQLVAGPIVRYIDVANQLTKREVSFRLASQGVQRFIFGFAKKVILANAMGNLADTILSLPSSEVSTALMWFGMLAYTLQIYFDFSGYSDMAIGLGKVFGFNFPENFNFPYIANSIKDFWRRWHISLSTWFRDYLYIPLGGSHGSKVKTIRNLLIVFLLTGLWHGAAWNFIIWGLFHGIFLLIERIGFDKILSKMWSPLRIIYTLIIVVIGWVLFRMESMEDAINVFSRMAGLSSSSEINYYLIEYLDTKTIFLFTFSTLLALRILDNILNKLLNSLERNSSQVVYQLSTQGIKSILSITLFFISISYLSASSYNPFIYFRF